MAENKKINRFHFNHVQKLDICIFDVKKFTPFIIFYQPKIEKEKKMKKVDTP